jgi:hypothetical protein
MPKLNSLSDLLQTASDLLLDGLSSLEASFSRMLLWSPRTYSSANSCFVSGAPSQTPPGEGCYKVHPGPAL